jgi:hypothetical protein
MFVKYKTPLWYLNAIEGILDKIYVGSDEFDDDLKKMYCLADEINYSSKKMRQAVEHRNKIKRQYGERLDLFFNKRSCSSRFNLFEFCATTNEDFFSELFEAKKLMKELQEYILSSRQTIKNDLGSMHEIWKKWYRKLVCTEKEKEQPAPKKKYQLTLTRAESLELLKKLTYALRKDPTKDNFVMTLDEL